MAERTAIEWADSTWNPVVGCSVVSPGCTNCYAMRLAGTRLRHHPSRSGLTIDSKAGPVWNGEVKLYEPALNQPLRWRRSRLIFVCAHGDLFHEAVPDEWIDRVFAVMALAPQHTFLVLTKRVKRMREYICAQRDNPRFLRFNEHELSWTMYEGGVPKHIWLGVSVEDQARADERIPDLLATPAAKRFISAEPLLGPVDLRGWDWRPADPGEIVPRLDWVIAGGESGPNARPMHPEWARSLRDQCTAADVPFFFKQHGEWLATPDDNGSISYGRHQRHGWDIDKLGEAWTYRVGKKAAGRLLDGVEHNGFSA